MLCLSTGSSISWCNKAKQTLSRRDGLKEENYIFFNLTIRETLDMYSHPYITVLFYVLIFVRDKAI